MNIDPKKAVLDQIAMMQKSGIKVTHEQVAQKLAEGLKDPWLKSMAKAGGVPDVTEDMINELVKKINGN